ncbi:MAG: hypothetical protein R2991_05000 [Thermoanaerobaculia bacterium]
MMGRALLIIGWCGTLAFVATAVLGYGVDSMESMGRHMLVALVACFLLLFSHCWILFFLIGTGKAVKETVARADLEGDFVERTRRFKMESNPPMMLAMLLIMATFIVGGGVQTEVIPVWIHHALFFLTLAVQLWTLVVEHRVVAANARLLREVDGLARRAV